MKSSTLSRIARMVRIPVLTACVVITHPALSQQVSFFPYLQLGDNGSFGPTDQIVIAWQTDESAPNTSAYRIELRTAGHEGRIAHPPDSATLQGNDVVVTIGRVAAGTSQDVSIPVTCLVEAAGGSRALRR